MLHEVRLEAVGWGMKLDLPVDEVVVELCGRKVWVMDLCNAVVVFGGRCKIGQDPLCM